MHRQRAVDAIATAFEFEVTDRHVMSVRRGGQNRGEQDQGGAKETGQGRDDRLLRQGNSGRKPVYSSGEAVGTYLCAVYA
ncbi:hypothetical protein GCM10011411_02570 [Aurantiacibacter arachoides]|nr:hypothetical protein GCM10011411_02570 [Aurantiacibacter arachoides]